VVAAAETAAVVAAKRLILSLRSMITMPAQREDGQRLDSADDLATSVTINLGRLLRILLAARVDRTATVRKVLAALLRYWAARTSRRVCVLGC
jgi:hypothetical protein